MNYRAWKQDVPQYITDDPLWRVKVYRLALFAADIGWQDVTKLIKDRRTKGLSDQLYRTLGSVSANVAEGYSRGSKRDRARFYEYALGSARESRDWYFKARHVLSEDVLEHRYSVLTDIIRLLLTMVPQQRGHTMHEIGPTSISTGATEGVWCLRITNHGVQPCATYANTTDLTHSKTRCRY